MNYLMATNTDYENGRLTGAHFRFLELAKGLARENKVIMISRRIPQLEQEKNIVFYYIDGKDSHRMPDHIAAIIHVCKKIRYIEKNAYDVAVSFTPFITIAFRMSRVKRIVTLFREDLIEYHKIIGTNRLKILYYRLIELLAVRSSDKIIVQCEDDKKNLVLRNSRLDKQVGSKVCIQINNANASWMNTEQCIPSQNNIPNLLFIGDFSNLRKGHHILLEAASRLYDEGYIFNLRMAGDGSGLKEYVEKYKEYSRIAFLGKIKVFDHLVTSDMLIVSSLMDSCPNTVLEALNAGVAVYGSNRGGITDMLADREYLFEPDPDSLYAFLKNVLDSKKYLEDRVKQKKRKDELCFDWAEKIRVLIGE